MRHHWIRAVPIVAAAACLIVAAPARAQNAPARGWEPRGFDFTPDGVWRGRARQVREARQAAQARGDFASLNAALGQAAALAQAGAPAASALTLTGVLRVPVLLVRYKNTNAASLATPAAYNDALLAPTPTLGRPYNLRTFYEEMSNGLFSVQGQVVGWVTLDSNDTWYEGNCNGLCGGAASAGHVAQLIQEAMAKNDTLDFGKFDNDGIDGVPNSGDDDGFVDLVVLVQPEQDGACGPSSSNRNLWSHRFSYAGWTGTSLATNDLSAKAGFGNVRLNNYTIQSGVGGTTACDAAAIMSVGTTAHETGHGFGLPDFYDTNPNDLDDSEGIGHWGLMGSGNYARPASPAYMEGYSRNFLGWVRVVPLVTSGSYALGPYTVSDTIFQITPTGPNSRNEYFLLENRQGTMSDSALITAKGPGLLIWHVDPVQYAAAFGLNQVNSGPIHALNLMQADGLDNLGSSVVGVRNRGDAGDPFPGSTGNTVFGLAGNPSVRLNDGTLPPFKVDSIRQTVPGGEMRFRFTVGAITTVRGSDTTAALRVRGVQYNVYRDLFNNGDTITVDIDSLQTSADDRTQYRFVSWSDAGARLHVATMSAAGGTVTANLGRSFKVQYVTSGSGTIGASGGVATGSFVASTDSVTLTATANAGASFVGWTGDTTTQNAVLKLRMTRPYSVTASYLAQLVVVDTVLGGAVMGTPYQDTIRVGGGIGTYTFNLLSGALPTGVTLTGGGVLIGTPSKDSTFNFTVRVFSGVQTVDLPLRVVVTAPTLAVNSVVSQLLAGGTSLTANEITYLDLLGNKNGQYDVGDFLAWLDKTGTVVSADIMQRVMARSGR